MKILLLSFGPGDYCIEYANALTAFADVTMFAPDWLMGYLKDSADPRLDLRLLDWPRQRHPRNLITLVQNIRAIRALDPDIVHNLNEAYIWARFIHEGTRRYPIVTTIHDVDFRPGEPLKELLPRRLVNLNIRGSDAIIIHGRALRDQALGELPISPDQIHELPHLVIDRYRKLAERLKLSPKRDKRFNVLFFGRMHKYKGLDHLLEASRIVCAAAPHVHFTVAGTGDNLSSYKAAADPRYVSFIERRIGDEEVAQLFLDTDVVVLPYIAASQSGVLAVAASFSKPAIVTRVGGLPEFVEDGSMGLVVPPAEPEALAQAILRLATHPEECKRLGRNAGHYAKTTLSHSTIGAKAMEIYESILASKSQTR